MQFVCCYICHFHTPHFVIVGNQEMHTVVTNILDSKLYLDSLYHIDNFFDRILRESFAGM